MKVQQRQSGGRRLQQWNSTTYSNGALQTPALHGMSDTRCGRSDTRCGRSDTRCGRSDTRCGS